MLEINLQTFCLFTSSLQTFAKCAWSIEDECLNSVSKNSNFTIVLLLVLKLYIEDLMCKQHKMQSVLQFPPSFFDPSCDLYLFNLCTANHRTLNTFESFGSF